MIFSYSDFVTDTCSYSVNGALSKNNITRSVHTMLANYQLYFQDFGYCPSCKTKSKIVFDQFKILLEDYNLTTLAYECQICGWWEVVYRHELETDLIDEVDNTYNETFHFAILKGFDESNKNLPLTYLAEEFSKNKNIIYNIHARKMEELVQHVFSQFYNCEVIHVGKTGDGGTDLIMIEHDSPVLIQVKRRTKSDAIESVSTVRDLLGTMFIEKVRKGIIVSTADHFSIQSKKIRDNLLKSNRLESFEMIDLTRFSQMLNITYKKQDPAWKFASGQYQTHYCTCGRGYTYC